jgi:hypothetical protein
MGVTPSQAWGPGGWVRLAWALLGLQGQVEAGAVEAKGGVEGRSVVSPFSAGRKIEKEFYRSRFIIFVLINYIEKFLKIKFITF